MLKQRQTTVRVLTLLLVFCSGVALADGMLARFEGSENTRTAAFEAYDAWMLEWSTQSDDALPKIFELRLYDAGSGEFLGTVTQTRELGNGRKLFDESGRYQLDVVASNLNWILTITPVESDHAGVIKRRSEGQATIEDSANTICATGLRRSLRILAPGRRPDAVAVRA